MAEQSAVKEKKVLIIDDEISIREALKIFFNGMGYRTGRAVNGKEALEAVKKEDFDVIISDIRMDKMNGVEFVKKLKQTGKKIPVIFITAYPELNTAIEALRHGVVEYIIKPFDMRKLEEKVKEILKTKEYTADEETLRQRLREQKMDFLSRFSKELTVPLKPMAAYVQLLIKEEFGTVSKYQIEVLEKVQKNSLRLKKLVDDLVLLFRIENKEAEMNIRKTDIRYFINEIIQGQKDYLKEKGQDFEITIYDDIDSIYCDREKLKRVVFHLLDNAMKFSHEDSRIHILIRKFRLNKYPYIKVSVIDNSGILAGPDRKSVFRWFYEVNKPGDTPETSGVSGLGIGLTLSRLIVELHGGKIWIEDSVEGEETGNIFSFIIPEPDSPNN